MARSCVMRWPGVIQPGQVSNEIGSLQDFIPTFAAANGELDLVEKVKKGYEITGKTYKVHLDGVNLMPFLSGKEKKSPRQGFIYWSDDGDCMAVRVGRFKAVFAEQRATGLDVWREPLVPLRVPKFFDLRADPFERGEEGMGFDEWMMQQVPIIYLVQPLLAKWLSSFKEFPPRARAASFSIDQIVEKMVPKD